VLLLQAGAIGCLGNFWGGAVSPNFQLSKLTSQNLSTSVRKATLMEKSDITVKRSRQPSTSTF
jgi:hypothetical protein